MTGFFGMPTRGGKLTIVNCLLWAIITLGVREDMPVLMLPLYVAAWPLGLLIFVAPVGTPDLVLVAVLVGINSLLWGYGISWLQSLTIGRGSRPESARRGFEVISSVAIHSPAASGGKVDREP